MLQGRCARACCFRGTVHFVSAVRRSFVGIRLGLCTEKIRKHLHSRLSVASGKGNRQRPCIAARGTASASCDWFLMPRMAVLLCCSPIQMAPAPASTLGVSRGLLCRYPAAVAHEFSMLGMQAYVAQASASSGPPAGVAVQLSAPQADSLRPQRCQT